MHPAFSVIFLTTLIGAGQGLFLALYTGQVYSIANLLDPQDSVSFYAFGSLLSLILLGAGLLASFFHLGHPERAWRSMTQWRTSWLSREVIVLPLFMALVFVYGLLHYLGLTDTLFVVRQHLPVDATLMVGLLAGVVAFALYVCTAMIYASLKFLQEWHSPLTVFNYTLLGLASGFTLAAGFAAWTGANLVGFYVGWAIIFTMLGMISRLASLYRNKRIKRLVTLQNAIGVRHSKIVQKSQGFMGGSFNTREFFHGKSAGFVSLMRSTFIALVFVVPVVILVTAANAGSFKLLIIAFAVQYVGLLAERWHFFADAQHPQNLYYQSQA
ncbi:MAG: dimethyl sulfoxide reductase anchor subunit [Chromatiales bacterium]|jgi:DMSO reductase anchor subunit